MISRPPDTCCTLITPVVTPLTWFVVVDPTVFPDAVITRPSARNNSCEAVKFGIGTPEKERLAREIRTACGCGGTVKDGRIVIQGDQRSEVTFR